MRDTVLVPTTCLVADSPPDRARGRGGKTSDRSAEHNKGRVMHA